MALQEAVGTLVAHYRVDVVVGALPTNQKGIIHGGRGSAKHCRGREIQNITGRPHLYMSSSVIKKYMNKSRCILHIKDDFHLDSSVTSINIFLSLMVSTPQGNKHCRTLLWLKRVSEKQSQHKHQNVDVVSESEWAAVRVTQRFRQIKSRGRNRKDRLTLWTETGQMAKCQTPTQQFLSLLRASASLPRAEAAGDCAVTIDGRRTVEAPQFLLYIMIVYILYFSTKETIFGLSSNSQGDFN